jgi:hypothetical protein
MVFVEDHDANGSAQGYAIEHTREDLTGICFLALGDNDALPRAAAIEFRLNVGLGKRNPGGAAVHDAAYGRAMRFTKGADAKESSEAAGHGKGKARRDKRGIPFWNVLPLKATLSEPMAVRWGVPGKPRAKFFPSLVYSKFLASTLHIRIGGEYVSNRVLHPKHTGSTSERGVKKVGTGWAAISCRSPDGNKVEIARAVLRNFVHKK